MQQAILNVSGQLWARVDLLLNNWPWRLLRNDSTTVEAFYAEDGCCLDEWFSEPLRLALPAPSDMLTDQFELLLK
eukprot:3457372-Heterocapsa_arctica.AAC.1